MLQLIIWRSLKIGLKANELTVLRIIMSLHHSCFFKFIYLFNLWGFILLAEWAGFQIYYWLKNNRKSYYFASLAIVQYILDPFYHIWIKGQRMFRHNKAMALLNSKLLTVRITAARARCYLLKWCQTQPICIGQLMGSRNDCFFYCLLDNIGY